jgi:hypothetical protein
MLKTCTYIDMKVITNPMNNPENASPKGVQEIGIGPKEYRIPTAKDKTPNSRITGEVFRKSIKPNTDATTSKAVIVIFTVDSFKLYFTMALWLS